MSARILSSNEQRFFVRFFSELNISGISWLLLRNYENFPHEIGNDLDVYFPPSQVAHALTIFRRLISDLGGKILHIHQREYFIAVWFVLGQEGASRAMHIDFYHGAFTWHGIAYISESALLASKRSFNDYFVAAPAHEALNLILASLLWGGFFKERYRARINTLLSDGEHKDAFHRYFEQAFGCEFSFDNLSGSQEEIRAYAVTLRHRLKARAVLANPFLALAHMSRYWIGELKTVFITPGCQIDIPAHKEQKLDLVSQLEEHFGKLFGETHIVDLRPIKGGNFLLSVCKTIINVWKWKAKNHLIISIHNSKQIPPILWILWKPNIETQILQNEDGASIGENQREIDKIEALMLEQLRKKSCKLFFNECRSRIPENARFP